MKTKPHHRKTLTVAKLHHCMQTEEINYRNVFLLPDYVPSEHELPLP